MLVFHLYKLKDSVRNQGEGHCALGIFNFGGGRGEVEVLLEGGGERVWKKAHLMPGSSASSDNFKCEKKTSKKFEYF